MLVNLNWHHTNCVRNFFRFVTRNNRWSAFWPLVGIFFCLSLFSVVFFFFVYITLLPSKCQNTSVLLYCEVNQKNFFFNSFSFLLSENMLKMKIFSLFSHLIGWWNQESWFKTIYDTAISHVSHPICGFNFF